MLNEAEFLKSLFRGYYSKNPVSLPKEPERREFGIGEFGKKIVKRHMHFPSLNAFNSFLSSEAPLYVSCSNAYYTYPDRRPMEAKEFTGSDLIYEFDADDIPTDCKKKHDLWKCKSCGAGGKGALELCPKCGSASIDVDQWFCDECIGETMKQTSNLVEILSGELGFTGLLVNFSGNAGYHVHVSGESIRQLPQKGRMEILDYLTLNDSDMAMHGFFSDEKMMRCPSPLLSHGLRKRLVLGLRELVENASLEELAVPSGTRVKTIEKAFLDRKNVLEKMDSSILMPVSVDLKINETFWFSLIGSVAETLSLRLDRQTSIDLRKIVRVPDTLHGSTGLLAKTFSAEDLGSFKPFSDSVVLGSDPVKVLVKNVPAFNLNGERFGPFSGGETELPEFAAAFLVGKGKALIL